MFRNFLSGRCRFSFYSYTKRLWMWLIIIFFLIFLSFHYKAHLKFNLPKRNFVISKQSQETTKQPVSDIDFESTPEIFDYQVETTQGENFELPVQIDEKVEKVITKISTFSVGSNSTTEQIFKESQSTFDFEEQKLNMTSQAGLEELKEHTEKIEDGVCIPPKLPVWTQMIRDNWPPNKPLDCTKNTKFPPIFTTDLDSTLIRLKDPQEFNLTNCCYTQIITNKADSEESFANKCIPITSDRTLIPDTIEFFKISCDKNNSKTSVIDVVGFARFASPNETLERIKSYLNKFKTVQDQHKKEMSPRPRPNIIIVGVDSTSRLNLQRILPKTFKYVTETLGGIGVNGYNKVGLNTLPNLIALLSGKSIEELENQGKTKRNDRNKLVPLLADLLVWNKFAANGYLTSYLEDASEAGVFTYRRRGFSKPPTDFYARPLFRQLEMLAGHQQRVNYGLCYGWKTSINRIVDQMKQISIKVNNLKKSLNTTDLPFFKMVWLSALFHDRPSIGQLGDDDILSMFQWYKESSSDQLNNTIFIFMSDHGDRLSWMRNTQQGRMEEKMPFLYFIFPSWFQSKYSLAIENFKSNTNRLTTPWDVYETLVDLTNLKLDKKNLVEKSLELSAKFKVDQYPRGISLMVPIPRKRSCRQAGIPNIFCTCSRSIDLNVSGSGEQVKDIEDAAKVAVRKLNKEIEKENLMEICAEIQLHNVTSAQKVLFDSKKREDGPGEGLKLTFYTQPGWALYEGLFYKDLTKGGWWVEGMIDRLNSYGNTSSCVSNFWKLKPICFCKNN